MPLAILGIGAVSSVGRTAASTAASVRAGIARPQPVLDPEILNEETHELAAIVGHPVRGLTDGFALLGRWLRLAMAATADLLRSLPDEARTPETWRRTGLLLVTSEFAPAVFLSPSEVTAAAVREQVVSALLQDLDLPVAPQHVHLFPDDHVGLALALRFAGEHRAPDVDRWLVLAVDSLLDPLLLETLAAESRLKHSGNPVGLSPGEGAAALILGEPTARVLGVVDRVVIDTKPNEPASNPVETGTRLAQVAAAANTGAVFVDMNGEQWRAQVWGHAIATAGRTIGSSIHLPAVSIGDTGAAGAAIAVVVAIGNDGRRGIRGGRAQVIACNLDGRIAAIELTTNPSWQP